MNLARLPPPSQAGSLRALRREGRGSWRMAGLAGSLMLAGLVWTANARAVTAGDPDRGRALLLQRHETGCILCHVVPGLAQGGALGPSLENLGSRFSKVEVRARIADARSFNPETIMPPYRSTAGLRKVGNAFAGKTILTEQALEDIVAYLLSAPPADVPPREAARKEPHAAR